MAGMLPGVEAARRRRFHQSNNLNNGGGSTRRSSFCLYATNYHEFHINSASSMERNPIREAAGCDDENLEAAAREAKKRLDHRLQTLWKSEIKRKQKGRERSTSVEGRLKAQGHLQTDTSTSMRKTGYQNG